MVVVVAALDSGVVALTETATVVVTVPLLPLAAELPERLVLCRSARLDEKTLDSHHVLFFWDARPAPTPPPTPPPTSNAKRTTTPQKAPTDKPKIFFCSLYGDID